MTADAKLTKKGGDLDAKASSEARVTAMNFQRRMVSTVSGRFPTEDEARGYFAGTA